MNQTIEKLTIAVLLLLSVAFLGCAAFQESVIPTYIPPDCIDYADVNVPVIMPYTTMLDSKYVDAGMDLRHDISGLKFQFLKDQRLQHFNNADQMRQAVFSPDGPIGLLLPMMTGLGIGALGLSKPSDKKKIKDLENGTKTNS